MTNRRLPILVALLLVLACAAAVDLWAYWPGLMTWDAIRQYDQALSGAFDDWHPPVMEWLWRRMLPLHAGPQPMLLVQHALYWGGFGLLAARAVRDGRAWLGGAIAMCALNPLALGLMGAVLKDCLMAGALLAASGLLAWTGTRRGWLLRAPAIGLLLFAAMLRFNAFLACLPLLVALLPPQWRSSRSRLIAASAAAAALLVAAMPLANRAIGAERSGVELSLIIFDLGGIGVQSGAATFPAIGVDDPITVNRRCYSPVKWDTYSWWVDAPCPIGFEPLKAHFEAGGESAYRLWLRTILAHPVAYAKHRLAHFAINTRIVPLDDAVERPLQAQSASNDWGYRVTQGTLLRTIDRAALAVAHTPLGWPIVWIAAALGVLVLLWPVGLADPAVALAASAFLYGLGYLPFSVAAELRYHLWTMAAAMLACLFGLARRPWRSASRARIVASGLPLAAALAASLLMRLL